MKAILLAAMLLSLISCDYEFRDVEILEGPAHKIGDKTCIMGDSGTGKEGQRKVAKLLEKENCDRIRIMGDIIYPDGLTSDQDPLFYTHFYNPYKNLLDQGVPFILSMGNHDHRENINSWLYLADQHNEVIYPNHFFAEKFGKNCYLTIDTNMSFHQEQRDWLDKTMPILERECDFIFSFSHHPYISSGKHGGANPFNKLFFKKYILGKSFAHFAGHDHHLSYEGVKAGTHHFVTGAGGKLRPVRALQFPKFAISTLGYINLIYMGGYYKYEFIGLSGNNKREVLFTGELKK